MKTNRRWEKHNPLAVIILATFFHGFSYHYGALSQKAVRQDGLFFIKGDLNSRALGKVPAEKQHAAYLIVPYRKLLHLIDFEKRLPAR